MTAWVTPTHPLLFLRMGFKSDRKGLKWVGHAHCFLSLPLLAPSFQPSYLLLHLCFCQIHLSTVPSATAARKHAGDWLLCWHNPERTSNCFSRLANDLDMKIFGTSQNSERFQSIGIWVLHGPREATSGYLWTFVIQELAGVLVGYNGKLNYSQNLRG